MALITESERHQLLVEWNNTPEEFPHDHSIHQLFEEQVEKTPWQPNPVVIGSLMKLAAFFQISQNILDSGPRILTTSDGTPRLDLQGRQMVVPGKSVLNVLWVALGLRVFAVALAALTGVR